MSANTQEGPAIGTGDLWPLTTLAATDSQEIVRLRTSVWADKRGLHIKRSLTFLRKRSSADAVLLQEEISAVGAEEAAMRIVNLDSCEDGVYRVARCNESRDWETGYIEDFDFRLEAVK